MSKCQWCSSVAEEGNLCKECRDLKDSVYCFNINNLHKRKKARLNLLTISNAIKNYVRQEE